MRFAWTPWPLRRRVTPGRTVRLRMTVLYGCLFLGSGVVLLAMTYGLLVHAVSGHFMAQGGQSAFQPAPGTAGADGGPLAPSGAGTPSFHPAPGATPISQSLQSVSRQVPPEIAAAMAREKDAVLHQLLVQSAIALVFTAALAMLLGWLVTGRVLRPLQVITRTVRQISATSLHERLALAGPADELKELGDTFDSLLGRLEAAFAAHRSFVANASHELKTPLARQRVIGQLALSDPEASMASLRVAHERILLEGEQQERMIEALLTLARGNAGIEIPHPFDLTALTREVLVSREAEATVREVTIRSSLRPAQASGHAPLVERLIGNLVDNALRYNFSDGLVEVSTQTTGDRAVLTVTNTGPMVAEDDIERLFRPFQRLGAARTGRRRDGLGLGLSIVEAIAKAHGAVLTTAPRSTGGLSITVAFPASAAPPEPDGRRDAPGLSAGTARADRHRRR